jgi:hypothetical protein
MNKRLDLLQSLKKMIFFYYWNKCNEIVRNEEEKKTHSNNFMAKIKQQ